MSVAVWFALGVLIVSLIAGFAYVVLRALQLWRETKRVSGTLGSEVDRVSAETARIEHHLANAEAATGRLKTALERLSDSRARLGVQRAAVREARAQLRRVFWFVPGI